ncbi:MAG: glucose-6-phosphate dehydrogenase assembly protein OpcA, partial [Rothia dentocariosa]
MISHLQHTNVSAISKELSSLLASNGSLSSSRVLTLVVLAEKGHSRESINAAIRASHEHPSRIIVHIAHNSDAPDQLDAEIHVGGEAGASELIILR